MRFRGDRAEAKEPSPTLPGLQNPLLPKQRLKGGQELVRKGVVAVHGATPESRPGLEEKAQSVFPSGLAGKSHRGS